MVTHRMAIETVMASIPKTSGARSQVTSSLGVHAGNARLVHVLTASTVRFALVVLILTARSVPTLAPYLSMDRPSSA